MKLWTAEHDAPKGFSITCNVWVPNHYKSGHPHFLKRSLMTFNHVCATFLFLSKRYRGETSSKFSFRPDYNLNFCLGVGFPTCLLLRLCGSLYHREFSFCSRWAELRIFVNKNCKKASAVSCFCLTKQKGSVELILLALQSNFTGSMLTIDRRLGAGIKELKPGAATPMITNNHASLYSYASERFVAVPP